jgi:hypothetical protein
LRFGVIGKVEGDFEGDTDLGGLECGAFKGINIIGQREIEVDAEMGEIESAETIRRDKIQ